MGELERNRPFFSVIMPVYNGAKYISKAIDSILQQSYGDFELILVDDQSTDDSWKIINDFAAKDSRIVSCQTKENLGVANARNEGMAHVTGRYLTFVDADDYVEVDLFQLVRERIDETSAILIKYSVIEEYLSDKDELVGSKRVVLEDTVYTTTNEVRNAILLMERKPLFGYLCNGFYSLEVFPPSVWKFDIGMKVNEDFMMNMKLIDRVDCMACMSFCGYHYAKRIENSSLSSKKNDEYYTLTVAKIEVLRDKYIQWNLYDSTNRMEILWFYIRIIYSAICRILSAQGVSAARSRLNEIRNSDIFVIMSRECQNDTFTDAKKKFMWYLLESNKTYVILSVAGMMNFVKSNMRVFFARIKE